ncbi:MAG: thioredoxin domain-containing protein, partial [Deltaproteobacteria bacterium]|nr:thioredoxin domain-containing protein [Deltaproteobacteria bacterium]
MTNNEERPRERPNRLARQKSPYLLQHANNPVDWHPWDEEAFAEARRRDKPVFLSIGYSTCHWCHVMAHESFEDEEVASLLNSQFICIKVDREERPDIDGIYMTVCQLLTGHGGWPLTIIMTPDKRPFFAATYLPKKSGFGRVGMLELIPRISEIWMSERERIMEASEQITGSLRRLEGALKPGEPSPEILKETFEELQARFDRKFGGFGPAPKFPIPHQLLFLLRYWKRSGEKEALEMAERTLIAMRRGGLYDQLGFGFHRYSTDDRWLVPHFEKMLYDQALLALAYLEAFQASGKEIFGRTAKEIFTYVLRDMTSPEGGFYSALDADSEGEEGRFYLWSEKEVRTLLDREEADLFIAHFGIEGRGNFMDEASGGRRGLNILHLETTPGGERPENTGNGAGLQLETARKKLLSAREKRVPPLRDDKILTDWNGLMIAALARGAWIFADKGLLDAARSAAEFIDKRMHDPKGRLLHRYREGEAAIRATLDDYTFLIWGYIELYEAAFDARDLRAALRLQEEMDRRFRDDEKGGYYCTAGDGEDLLVRRKEIYDGAQPSGNAAALWNLIRLGRITGNPHRENRAMEISRAFSGNLREHPSGHSLFMVAFDALMAPSLEIVISGKKGSADTEAMLDTLRHLYLPGAVILFRPPG